MKLSEENQRKVEKNLGLVHKVINDRVHGPYQLGIYARGGSVPDWMHRAL